MLLSLAYWLPDAATYAQMLDDDGEYTASHWGLFFISLVFGAFNIGWVWVGACLYGHAVSNQQPNRDQCPPSRRSRQYRRNAAIAPVSPPRPRNIVVKSLMCPLANPVLQ